MGSFRSAALQLLAENGIEFPEPGQWFPQQSWLNAFKVIAERVGDATLHRIGRAILEHAQWPPVAGGLKNALASIDVAYHRIGRRVLCDAATGEVHEGIGHYAFQDDGTRSACVVCDNPYPCAFDQGIVQAVAESFCAPGDHVRVAHADSGCRRAGDPACSYTVSW